MVCASVRMQFPVIRASAEAVQARAEGAQRPLPLPEPLVRHANGLLPPHHGLGNYPPRAAKRNGQAECDSRESRCF
jgi:hypothetical protein